MTPQFLVCMWFTKGVGWYKATHALMNLLLVVIDLCKQWYQTSNNILWRHSNENVTSCQKIWKITKFNNFFFVRSFPHYVSHNKPKMWTTLDKMVQCEAILFLMKNKWIKNKHRGLLLLSSRTSDEKQHFAHFTVQKYRIGWLPQPGPRAPPIDFDRCPDPSKKGATLFLSQ